MRRIGWLLVSAALLVIVVGVTLVGVRWLNESWIVDRDQERRVARNEAVVGPDAPPGQTFVARHAGLAGIEFYLLPHNSVPLSLTLHLRSDTASPSDLTSGAVHLPAGASAGFYRFRFPPQADSHNQYYYALVESTERSVQLAMAEGDTYLHGSAHVSHQPLDAQLTFRLVYAPRPAFVNLLAAIPGWLGLFVLVGLAFILPGWALLAWLWPSRELAWGASLGLAAGIGIAIYPILMLWTHLIGVNLASWYAWLPIAGGAAFLAWKLRSWRPAVSRQALGNLWRSKHLWPDVALVVVTAICLFVRLLAVRGLEAPLWGDGYQHTLITQLLVDNGGLFESWAPYVDLDRFTYHFGFHAVAAVVHWLSGLPAAMSTLYSGQIVNGLAVLATYPLATSVTRSRWGGVWAVLFAGLLSSMPMFYVNWGRYTQLAGLVVLPPAAYLTHAAVKARQNRWGLFVLASSVVGGLALTHYRVTVFYGVFAFALLLLALSDRELKQALPRLAFVGLGALLACLPWLLRALEGNLPFLVERRITTLPAQLSSFSRAYNAVGELGSYLSPGWWLAALAGLGLGLWRQQRGVLLTGLWYALLLLVANLDWLSLPGSGIITNFDVLIAAYLPGAVLTGFLGVNLLPALARRRMVAAAITVAIVSASAWGALGRLGDLDLDQFALLTRPDVRAAAWIRENTPTNARFAINSFPAYGGSLVVGSDGGWWLPVVADRQTTVPPLSYGAELPADSAYRRHVLVLASGIEDKGLEDPSVLNVAQQQQVTHVFLGQRQGEVNSGGVGIIDPHRLLQSSRFRPVYHQDRVWVFEITR